VIDHFSRCEWARFYENKSAANVVELMEEIMKNDGAPEKWLTDNGKEFVSKKVVDLMEKYGCKEQHGLPYKPSTQGSIERAHLTMQNSLDTVLIEHYKGCLPKEVKKANKILEEVIEAKNRERHSTTGHKPIEVNC
jgi:transposase InsO family protein